MTEPLSMIGKDGLVMVYADRHLSVYDAQCKDNLNDLLITGSGDVWICGDKAPSCIVVSDNFRNMLKTIRASHRINSLCMVLVLMMSMV